MFVIACLASLAYVFSRPAVYLSSARLQFDPPQGERRNDKADNSPNLLNAAQTLTGRGLFGDVMQRLAASGPVAPGAIASVDALQGMLSALPVSGTNVIELRAEGSERELLPRILEAWIDVYLRSNVKAYDQSATAALEEVRGVVQQLQEGLVIKRREIEAFRKKFDIISLERDDNQSVARLKGLNAALNDARSREANAEARLNAMRESVAAGKTVQLPGDKAIIADLERRAIDLRDRMKDLESDFTQRYLAADKGYKAMGANLARLEQQIERERQKSAQQAMQVAEDELMSARQTALRLQKELAARKQEVQEFTARFAEHSALANELRRLEEGYNSRKERLQQLEMEQKAAGPKVTVLSEPSIPDRALRPDYSRDALIGVAGSGVLGLLAVWFVEFFRRSGVPQPLPPGQPIIQIAIAPGAISAALTSAIGAHAPRLPETVARLQRVLSGPEVDALLSAAPPESRPVIAALLSGRAPPSDSQGAPVSSADLQELVARAASDAGLENPAEVTTDVLRQTYLGYLVRQGAS